MWQQQSETWGLPVHHSRCLVFTTKCHLCIPVFVNKTVCVCVHVLPYITRLRDPETDQCPAERGDGAKRDPDVRFQIGVRRWKSRAAIAKPEPLRPLWVGSVPGSLVLSFCWGRTIMVIMMNRAIWMPPSSCVICELCASHRLMSSQNEPARTQLRPWSSSGALPHSHVAVSKVHGEVCLTECAGLWLAPCFFFTCYCEGGLRFNLFFFQCAFSCLFISGFFFFAKHHYTVHYFRSGAGFVESLDSLESADF